MKAKSTKKKILGLAPALLISLLGGCGGGASANEAKAKDLPLATFEQSTSLASFTEVTASADLSLSRIYSDEGNALCVLPKTAESHFQKFVFDDEAAASVLAQVSSYSFLRLWVANEGGGTLTLITKGKQNKTWAPLGNGPISVTEAAGQSEEIKDSLRLRPAFEGWVAYPLPSAPLTGLSLEITLAGFTEGEDYRLDEIQLTKNSAGRLRPFAYPEDEEETLMEKTARKNLIFEEMGNVVPLSETIDDFAPTGSYAGIQALTYEGLRIGNAKTKVFAYLAMPKNASPSAKVPGVVLIHGGGGHPFLEWVKTWADRGYAALAMDTTGYFPTAINAGDSEVSAAWVQGLSGRFAEEGFVSTPDNDAMQHSSGPLEQQWMMYALGASLLGDNLLRSLPSVDSNKVGVMGISWGGVIASLLLGYAPSLAFAMPIYGSGYLDEALSYQGRYFSAESTKALWLAQDRFSSSQIPVLWQGWNIDNNFSINSNSKSYLSTKSNPNTVLSMVNGMRHSHSMAWAREEPFLFADSLTKGGAKMTRFLNEPSGRSLHVALALDKAATKTNAKLYYLTSPLSYSASSVMEESWETSQLTVADALVTGEVPADALAYYIEIKTTIGGENYISTSSFVEIA